MNLKKYVLISLFTFSSIFACFNPTYYAAWPEQMKPISRQMELISYSIQKELRSGQIMQIELPLELEEALDEMVNMIDSAVDTITRNETNRIEESGIIKDGRAWKLIFTQDKTTKQIDCKLEFPAKKIRQK